MTPLSDLIDAVTPHLGAYLVNQRWYAGPEQLPEVQVVHAEELCSTGDGARHLYALVVDTGAARYQVLVGRRPLDEPVEALAGRTDIALGSLDGSILYDATFDAELTLPLLGVVTGGIQTAGRVRPISAEQSNTSLVYDDRIILKLYRRLLDGEHNPDIEVTTALADAGFGNVARPYGVWRRWDTDLAFAQEFLAGGAEGWALALTSLRDFYESQTEDPAEVGGDFSMEARRLGRVTAQLHLAMARAFPTEPLDAGRWSSLVGSVADRLAGVEDVAGLAATVTARLAAVSDPGPAVRVHGDFHLGQVMRADNGWYVLDFEGEPARPRHERVAPASPLKDVAGMLRSFDYASRAALAERGSDPAADDRRAVAWSRHNRTAFLEGYEEERGIGDLLPAGRTRDLVLSAYELDKALYEVGYERAYRPSWEAIPLAAVRRIAEGLAG